MNHPPKHWGACLALLVVSLVATHAAGGELPAGWTPGEPAPPERAPRGEPACCALGLFHPCCAPQKRMDAQAPPTVAELREVDLATLPTVDLRGCNVELPRSEQPLPPATDAAAAHGLRIYGEGKAGPLTSLHVGDPVRLVPAGRAGAVEADNVGVWWYGESAAFVPRSGDPLDWGIEYRYGAPWPRLDWLAFESLLPVDDGFHYRFFDGSLDIVTGKVGASCSYEAPLGSLIGRWMYGFVGVRDEVRELHVITPAGGDVLSVGSQIDRDQVHEHFVLPLDRTNAAAVSTNAFTWSRVQDAIPEPHWGGVLSVHVVKAAGMGEATVLVARER